MESPSAEPEVTKTETAKRPSRSTENRMIAGVAGGIAEYLHLDPSLVRVIVVAIVIFSAIIPGLLLYMACVLILPEKTPEAG